MQIIQPVQTFRSTKKKNCCPSHRCNSNIKKCFVSNCCIQVAHFALSFNTDHEGQHYREMTQVYWNQYASLFTKPQENTATGQCHKLSRKFGTPVCSACTIFIMLWERSIGFWGPNKSSTTHMSTMWEKGFLARSLSEQYTQWESVYRELFLQPTGNEDEELQSLGQAKSPLIQDRPLCFLILHPRPMYAASTQDVHIPTSSSFHSLYKELVFNAALIIGKFCHLTLIILVFHSFQGQHRLSFSTIAEWNLKKSQKAAPAQTTITALRTLAALQQPLKITDWHSETRKI